MIIAGLIALMAATAEDSIEKKHLNEVFIDYGLRTFQRAMERPLIAQTKRVSPVHPLRPSIDKSKLRKKPPVTKPPREEPEAKKPEQKSPRERYIKKIGKGRYSLDFEQADITEVVKAISELTGKNFILSDKVRGGKITIISPTKVTAKEAYRAFLSALDANNMTIVPAGKYLRITQKQDSIQQPIPTYIEDRWYPTDDRMITRLYALKYVEVDQIASTIRSLASRQGNVTPYVPTNTLIITDVASNIHRLIRIIERLDVPMGKEKIWVVQINYADAATLSNMLMQVFERKKPKGRRKTPPVIRPHDKKAKPRSVATADRGAETEVQISKIIPDERTNKLIIVADDESYKELSQLIAKLDVPIPGEGQIHVHYLKNADAEELSQTLSALVTGRAAVKRPPAVKGRPPRAGAGGAIALFEGEVKITADKPTNSLVIIASLRDYKALSKIIEKLDIPRRQVFVEAVIMEISVDKARDIGLAFHVGSTTTVQGETVPMFAATTFEGLSSIVIDPASLISLLGFLGGVRGPEVEGLAESLGLEGISIPAFGVIFSALQRNKNVNVLSTPHILTMDNQEAELMVGQNIPYQAGFYTGYTATGTAATTGYYGFAPTVSISRMDVALKLKIKPQITESDFIRLEIDQEISEVMGTDPLLGPTTSKRTAKTTVVVKDQQTVVIGGLMRERVNESQTKVPFLGDIPIIGWFFKSTIYQKEKNNLIIFLTPTIIKTQEDFRKIFERKMKERMAFVERFYEAPQQYRPPIDYSRKFGPLQVIHRSIRRQTALMQQGKTPEGDIIITPQKSPPKRENNPDDGNDVSKD